MVGRGVTVGRPLGLLLTRRSENATVTLCHTGTRDLAAHVRTADIVVAAAGVPGIITADMVKPGAAVLDVGVSRVDGKIAGDVAADVYDVAGWVSPNPGGVGPMTRAMLLSNIVQRRRAVARAGRVTLRPRSDGPPRAAADARRGGLPRACWPRRWSALTWSRGRLAAPDWAGSAVGAARGAPRPGWCSPTGGAGMLRVRRRGPTC